VTRIWQITHAPHGAPAAFLVQSIDCEPGKRPAKGPLVNAASEDQARETFPRDGLERNPPRKGDDPALVETWEPPRPKRRGRK